uniref:Transposase n=1 Tax=Steinernema glaseri TaxID=37863 RepID=A0A1I8ALQ4_9BILA
MDRLSHLAFNHSLPSRRAVNNPNCGIVAVVKRAGPTGAPERTKIRHGRLGQDGGIGPGRDRFTVLETKAERSFVQDPRLRYSASKTLATGYHI